MAKAYDYYLACCNDGMNHDEAIAEAAWLYDLPVAELREYIEYHNSLV